MLSSNLFSSGQNFRGRSLLLWLMLSALLFVPSLMSFAGTINGQWTTTTKWDYNNYVTWNADEGRYEFAFLCYDFEDNDNWISYCTITAKDGSTSYPIFCLDNGYQADGNYVYCKVKAICTSSYGNVVAYALSNDENAQSNHSGNLSNYVEIPVSYVNSTTNDGTTSANGWQKMWTYYCPSTWDRHYIEVYFYPNSVLMNKSITFNFSGKVRNSKDKSWDKNYNSSAISSSYSLKNPVLSSHGWDKSSGSYTVSGYNQNDNYGIIGLDTKVTGTSSWNSRSSYSSVSGGVTKSWSATWIPGYVSGTSGTAPTRQQFANGFDIRLYNYCSPAPNSPYIPGYGHSSTVTSEKFPVLSSSTLGLSQNSRTITLNWSVLNPVSGGPSSGTFGIMKYSTTNKRWEEIATAEYMSSKTSYSYDYTLSDDECNQGDVTYQFLVWYKFFDSENLWTQYMRASGSINVHTNYKSISISNVTPVSGKTEAVVSWVFDSNEGVWDSQAAISLIVTDLNGNTQRTLSPTYEQTSMTVGSLVSCHNYSYTIKTTVLSKSYQTTNSISILQPDVNSRDISSFEASKGYYSDYVQLRWEVPADASDFDYFDISRQSINGGDKISVTQITHSGLTSYSYQDREADAGALYTYYVEGYSTCDGKSSLGKAVYDIGFSQPYATVSGRVTYDSNQAVEGVTISISGGEDQQNNYSLYFDGASSSSYALLPSSVADLNSRSALSFQAYVYPQQVSGSSADRFIVSKGNVFALALNSSNQLKVSVGGKSAVLSSVVLPNDVWSQISVALQLDASKKSATLYVYLDGDLAATKSISSLSAANFANYDANDCFLAASGAGAGLFKGNIEEVRFWASAISESTVANNYDAFMNGRESSLVAYYRCDESGVQSLFDISGSNGSFNKNHGSLGFIVSHSTNVPSASQLSNKTLTDEDGNYLINTIPYTSEGIQYNVIPTFGIHSFSPNKRPIFASSSSVVFNSIDFDDNSSFTVSGYVFYENTEYPVQGVNFYVDGTICSKDGQAVESDENGYYEISVPIGDHHIVAQKQGHSFVANGRYPSNALLEHTFDQTVSNLTFWDNTLVTVAGRVCGGDVEADKVLGLAQSVNNIGVATVDLVVDAYRMNCSPQDDGSFADASLPRNVKNATDSTTCLCSGFYGYGDNSLTHHIYVMTDPATGEWAVKLPPVAYSVNSVKVNAMNVDANDKFGQMSFSNIDASNAQVVYTDSLENEDGSYSKFEYTASLVINYNSEPSFIVEQSDNSVGAFGEASYDYADLASSQTISLYSVGDGAVNYTFGHPVFLQNSPYTFHIQAYEEYVNYDADEPVSFHVPLSGATVSLTNEMSTAQSVYVEDGEVDGQQVKQGDFVELTSNEFELDDNGEADYQWTAGFPSISGDNTLGLNISLNQNGRTSNWDQSDSFRGIVLGYLPSGNNFVTSGPDKVLMILRDPAGSGSSAFWEEGVEITNEETDGGSFISQNEVTTQTSFGLYGTTITGTPGFGVINEVGQKNTLEVGLNVNTSLAVNGTWTTTSTTTKRISTSDGTDYVGAQGDVFVGSATNIIFGNSRTVDIAKNADGDFEIALEDKITTGSQFSTGFNYTQNYIEQSLIPNLILNRDALLQTYSQDDIDLISQKGNDSDEILYLTTLSPDDERFGSTNFDSDVWGDDANTNKSLTYGPSYTMVLPAKRDAKTAYQDMVLWYNEQIKLWKQTLADNEKAKVTAINDRDKWLDENVSFDAGAIVEASSSNCSGSSTTIEREVETLVVLGLETGFEVNKTGVDLSMKTTTGVSYSGSTTSSSQTCVSTGYSLVEDGDDDAISLDVFNAPDGFGAIFVTRGGQTSCPYEDEVVTKYYEPGTVISNATMQIEVPVISAVNTTVTDVPSGGQAVFTLQLKNESEIGENVWFKLGQVLESNPNGAILQLNGMSLTANNIDVLVKAGEVTNLTLVLKQGNPDILDYENIGVKLFSSCQWDETAVFEPIQDIVYLNAHFVPSCSEVSLSANSTTINSYTDADFSATIRDYDPGYSNFQALRVLYKQDGDVKWTQANEYVLSEDDLTVNNQLLPSGGRIYYDLDMSNSSLFPDGNYLIRVQSVCGYGNDEVTAESNVVSFVKDVAKPKLLGLAQPADGILDADDEISVSFNEDIRTGSLTKTNNFSVTGVLNDAQVDHSVALKLDGADFAAKSQANVALANHSFAIDAWVYLQSAGTIVEHGSEKQKLAISVNDLGNLILSIGDSSYVSDDVVPFDKWVFLTLNYSADSKSVDALVAYDAYQVALFKALPVADYSGAGVLTVGRNISGAISELALWNTNRSTTVAQSEMYTRKAASTQNLVGYWRFDEGHGTLASDVARGRNMVLASDSWYLNNVNYAAHLDGDGSCINLYVANTAVESTADYMVELWFRGASQSNAYLWNFGNSQALLFNESGLLSLLNNGDQTVLSSTDYLDNAWHHVAFNVLRNGMSSVYVDGSLVKQISSSFVATPASAYLSVGKDFSGDVDEVRFWIASLNATTIDENRFLRLNGDEDGLVAYYPFESSVLDVNRQKVTSFDAADMSASDNGEATLVAVSTASSAPALKSKPESSTVSFDFVASERQIVLSLTETAARLEGSTLTFTVQNVRDLNENISDKIIWTAFVNQNRLLWADDEVAVEQQNLVSSSFKVAISNLSGVTENWSISGLPSWLSASKSSGSLKALSSEDITFTVAAATPIGSYEETIYLSGNDNLVSPLTVSLKVAGVKPDWSVNPEDFDSNMSLVAQLQFDGDYSDDSDDLVAAFDGNTCVGVASPVYYDRYDAFFVMMDIYGNAKSVGNNISFKAWDASTGITYPEVVASQSVSFQSTSVYGSMSQPVILNALGSQESTISLKKGWNWISLNVAPSDGSVSNVMSAVKSLTSIIKSKTAFAQPTRSAWAGLLKSVEVGQMYRVKTTDATSLSVVGDPDEALSTPVSIVPGWNWIGFNMQQSASLSDALADLQPVNGDLIKGQSGFAIYQDYEWVGSLKALAPGAGYMFFSYADAEKSFSYPALTSFNKAVAVSLDADVHFAHNAVLPTDFAGNMTIFAVVRDDAGLPVANAEVAVLAGSQCRTVARSDADGVVCLTVPGDEAAALSFDVDDAHASNEIVFSDNAMLGSPADPYVISVGASSGSLSGSDAVVVEVYPNPAAEVLHVDASAAVENVSVFSIAGQRVYSADSNADVNVANWNVGVYTVVVRFVNGNVWNGSFIKK